jgi:hypothetical protein
MQQRGNPRVGGVRILGDESRDRTLRGELRIQHDRTGLGLRQVAPVSGVREKGQRLRIRALQRRDVRDAELGDRPGGVQPKRTASSPREAVLTSDCPLRQALLLRLALRRRRRRAGFGVAGFGASAAGRLVTGLERVSTCAVMSIDSFT